MLVYKHLFYTVNATLFLILMFLFSFQNVFLSFVSEVFVLWGREMLHRFQFFVFLLIFENILPTFVTEDDAFFKFYVFVHFQNVFHRFVSEVFCSGSFQLWCFCSFFKICCIYSIYGGGRLQFF